MIDAYTINGAYLQKTDHITGSIEPGKYADLIILDRNLFDIPSTEISEARVLATFFSGQKVAGELPNIE